MPVSRPTDSRQLAAEGLRRGQACEAQGTAEGLTDAIEAYDLVIATLRELDLGGAVGVRYELGVAWMNRGNALEKKRTPAALREAVIAYDEAITLLRSVAAQRTDYRNSLGAAWLNRGHALLQVNDAASLVFALASFTEAIAELSQLPFEHVAVYRRNLAGAHVNLANALLLDPAPGALERAHTAARLARDLVADHEAASAEFTDLGLKARRSLCDVIGRMLVVPGTDQAALADEASDLVDEALAMAQRWEDRNVPHFRLLATRFFRFGTELHRFHQPHFLAEFVLENLVEPSAPESWRRSPEMREIALHALAQTQARLRAPAVLTVGDLASERALATHRSLAEATAKLNLSVA